MRILVAGVGSILQGDDGFGVEVAHRLQKMDLPSEVTVVETGTGGIHLVQEMLAGFDALIIIDAVDHGRPPGTVLVIEPEIMSAHDIPGMQKYDFLADMHYTKPAKALMLAKTLKILPAHVLLVGCQPLHMDRLETALSEPVTAAVETAVGEIQRIVEGFIRSGDDKGGRDAALPGAPAGTPFNDGGSAVRWGSDGLPSGLDPTGGDRPGDAGSTVDGPGDSVGRSESVPFKSGSDG